MKDFVEFVDANALSGRYLKCVIANRAIEIIHSFKVFELIVIEEVDFVEYYGCRDVVGFGSSEKTIDESGSSSRVGNSYDEYALVEVCGNDMKLFREISRFAYNIVAAVVEGGDVARFGVEFNAVAHSDWVSSFDAFDSEIAFDFAREVALFVANEVVGTCSFYD